MKFRTKLFILFFSLAFVTNGIVMGVLYYQGRQALRDEVGTVALSIAATVAAFIDGEEHEQLHSLKDHKTALYEKLETVMRKARDANRRDDLRVKYIYSVIPDSTDEDGYRFIVDAEEDGPEKSYLDDPYKPESGNFKLEPGKYQIMDGFIEDEWGTWLTAAAPIRKADGTTVATLLVDIEADDVIHELRLLFWSGMASLKLGIIAAVGMAIVLSHRAAKPLRQLKAAADQIGMGDLTTVVNLNRKDEFGEVGDAMDRMVLGLRQREQLKGSLARYVSAHVAERILQSGEVPALTGERKTATILILDVRGFTTISEKLAPELVVSLLNELFEETVEIILQHEGFLDKFLGDGLLAIFGALSDDPQQEEHAIQAALDIRKVVARLNEHWKKAHQLELRVGIGINTGPVIFGHIGSERRMDLTAIGDTVNLASRVESASKELNVDIVITEFTVSRVHDRFGFTELKSIFVKGRTAPVTVYTIDGAPVAALEEVKTASAP